MSIETVKTETATWYGFYQGFSGQNGKRNQNGIRQNGKTGTAKRRNGKIETDKTAKRPVKIETAKCKTVKPKRQNGKTVKMANGKNGKRQNGQL